MKISKWNCSNKKAFKALALAYASLTVQDLKDAEQSLKEDAKTAYLFEIEPYGTLVMGKLTGFSTENCSLCLAVNTCHNCYWVVTNNTTCSNSSSFKAIHFAKDAEELKLAIDARSKFMNSLL